MSASCLLPRIAISWLLECLNQCVHYIVNKGEQRNVDFFVPPVSHLVCWLTAAKHTYFLSGMS